MTPAVLLTFSSDTIDLEIPQWEAKCPRMTRDPAPDASCVSQVAPCAAEYHPRNPKFPPTVGTLTLPEGRHFTDTYQFIMKDVTEDTGKRSFGSGV